MDPGDGPFILNETDTRLDISDADFVDIIHRNGGDFMNGEIAFIESIGHVDFYVNGGYKQPGCQDPDFSKFSFVTSSVNMHLKLNITCKNICSAVDLFAESINTEVGFVLLRCDSYETFLNGSCHGNDRELMEDTVSLK